MKPGEIWKHKEFNQFIYLNEYMGNDIWLCEIASLPQDWDLEPLTKQKLDKCFKDIEEQPWQVSNYVAINMTGQEIYEKYYRTQDFEGENK